MSASFLITKDNVDGGAHVGIVGPGGAPLSEKEIRSHPQRQRFRMASEPEHEGWDYYGLIVGGEGFEPLDCFGMPNAGCTIIQYWEDDGNGGKAWQTL